MSQPRSSCQLPARVFALAALLVMPLLGAPAWAQTTTLPVVDAGFVLPADAAHEAAALDTELADVEARLRRALRLLADASLEDLSLLGEQHPDRVRERYATEIAVLAAPRDISAWSALYDELADYGRHDAALGAAWRLYELAGDAGARAAALLRLADVYVATGQQGVARNVAALAVRENPSEAVREAWAALEARLRLHVTDIFVEAEQALPRACLTLSRTLAASQPIPLADLVSLAPAADVLVSADGAKLCIAGLAHGVRYTLTLHAGLRSGDGEALARAIKRDIDVPHRQPSVAFAPGAYVLPRAPRSALPVRSVNLAEVPLVLYRVDDRNLVNAALADLVAKPLSRWERDQLGGQLGTRVWEGALEVANEPDREVVTNLPLEQLLQQSEPGVYALTAPLPDVYSAAATQWLVVSDLAPTSFAAADGLHVFVRSLADSVPRANVELTLVATNNRVLGTARTDSAGYARFAPGLLAGSGGDAAALLTLVAGGDYNFLLLQGPALDLGERGVGGRTPPGPADAFLYTERGIYRPGETAHLSLLLRDRHAQAMPTLPVTVRVTRPGGVVVFERVLTSDALGAAQVDVPLSDAALAGEWSVGAWLDPAGTAVGSTRFQVEDFVPPRIEVTASMGEAPLLPGAAAPVTVQADFYYGAPAADLKVDGRLRIETEPTPFADFAAFAFGREDQRFAPLSLPVSARVTDAAGATELSLRVPAIDDRSQPLRARVSAAVHDVGGRPVYASVSAPLALHPRYVGLRADFRGAVADGETAGFELVAVSPTGAPQAGARLRYEWVREHYDYVWYVNDGRWSWRESVIDEPVASESASSGADGRLRVQRLLPSGRYRLDVYDANGSASASRRFHVGWWRGAQAANVPDALDITLGPREGARQSVFIDAPFAGRALVVLGNEVITRHFEVELPEDGREIAFDVDPAWSPGLYVMVTAFRPLGAEGGSPLPSRAMGLAWLAVGVAERTLGVTLQPPAEVRPRQTVSIPLQVDGAAGERVGISIAAVDEGVLALTAFATPDPAAHYFGQRALAADLRDLYGELIATLDAPLGTLRSGGGAAGADNVGGIDVRSSRVVSLFDTEVTVDADGAGTVELPLPDFNGRLRLMAVAWGARRLGAGSADLLVRDPVVADLALPRFLAPGDRAVAHADVRNPGDQPVTLWLSASADATLALDFPRLSMTLAPGEARVLPVMLEAREPGAAAIRLDVELGDGSRILREYALAVRPAAANTSTRSVYPLGAGDSLVLDGAALDDYHAGARLDVSVTNGVSVDTGALLAALVDYPYGCTEQTVSRVLPQLYVDGGAPAFNTITAGIARVLDRQRHDGYFGVWSASGRAPAWLTGYAYEFLWLARERGFDVPDAPLALAERALRGVLAGNRQPHAAAYAAYLLARSGRAKPAEIRRFALAHGDALPSRLALAHAAAALALVGDRDESARLFEAALRKHRTTVLDDYGSDLRDAAAMLALMAETGDVAGERVAVLEALERQLQSGTWFSTQEQAWLLIAAERVRAAAGTLRLRVAGEPREAHDGALVLLRDARTAPPALRVSNAGGAGVRVVSNVRGARRQPPPAQAEGYRIERHWYDPDTGEAVDPASVARGRQVLVVIEGESLRRVADQHLLVVDLLPAGFEIENTALAGGAAELPEFVGLLSDTEFVAARDDRYVAALDIDGERRFRLAYVLRAVTSGDFVAPGVQVEDMYAPRFRANGAAGRTRVLAP